MKNNKIICLLLQGLVIFTVSTLAVADVIRLDEGSSQDCDKFNQPKTVIIVHASTCPWSADYIDSVVSPLSTDASYKDWHYYKLPFTPVEHMHSKTICGHEIFNCPVTFIKNQNGQDSKPLHGKKTLEKLKKALDKAVKAN